MHKLFYPAIFHKAEKGGYWITFPDLPECMTLGDDMQHAYKMAFEALGLAITSRKAEQKPIPAPSEPFSVLLEKDALCVVIEFDMIAENNPYIAEAAQTLYEAYADEVTEMKCRARRDYYKQKNTTEKIMRELTEGHDKLLSENKKLSDEIQKLQERIKELESQTKK